MNVSVSKRTGLLAAAALTLIAAIANAGHHGEMKAKDIVDTAAATDGFQTLVAAVKAAGLVETLKGEGPFTVFAPTDAAFAAPLGAGGAAAGARTGCLGRCSGDAAVGRSVPVERPDSR